MSFTSRSGARIDYGIRDGFRPAPMTDAERDAILSDLESAFGARPVTVTCAGCGDDINPRDLSSRDEAHLTGDGYCPSCWN